MIINERDLMVMLKLNNMLLIWMLKFDKNVCYIMLR